MKQRKNWIKEKCFYKSKSKIKRDLENYFGEKVRLISVTLGKGYTVKYVVRTKTKKYYLRVANRADEKRFVRYMEPIYLHSYAARFKYEWVLLKRLARHNLAPRPVFLGKSFLLVEFIEGELFSKLLATNQASCTDLFKKILDKINKLYTMGIVLADLSPENIIICAGRPYFIDFEIFSELPPEEQIKQSLSKFILKTYRLLDEEKRNRFFTIIVEKFKKYDSKIVKDLLMFFDWSDENLKSFFKRVFNMLNSSNVDYLVLRNYEFLREKEEYEGDIDILTTKQGADSINRLLFLFGFKQIVKDSKECKYAMFIPRFLRLIRIHVHIDALYYHTLPILMGADLLTRKKKIKNFYIPSDEDLLIELVCHSIFRRRFKKKYKKIINNLLAEGVNWKYVYASLASQYSSTFVPDIIKNVKAGDHKSLINMRRLCYFALLRRFPHKLIQFVLSRAKYYYLAKTQRLKKPKIVAFVGSDGAGKTTLIQGLSRILNENGQNHKVVYMGRWRARIITMRLAKTKIVSYKKTKKHNALFRQLFWTIDQWLRYCVIRFGKNKFIMTDRYAYDLLALPKVFPVTKILLAMYPKPDIVFFLSNEPAELVQRKGGIEAEIRRETIALRRILNRLGANVKEVRTDDLQSNLHKIIECVMGLV